MPQNHKLFDRLSKENQEIILKQADKGLVEHLKGDNSLFQLTLVNVLLIWFNIKGDTEFDLVEFKKLFI